MQGSCPPRPRVRGPWLAALLPLFTLAGCADAAAGAPPWAFGGGALCVGVGLGYVIGHLRTHQHTAAALRAARREVHELAALLDSWSWRSDAQHHLQRLQPPAGATPQQWARAATSGALMWECFESAVPGDDGGLRARLQAQQPFGELVVRRIDDGSRWLLRAAPCFDDAGAFAGYSGGARPTAEHDTLRADQQALQALLPSLEVPVLLATGDGSATGWQLRHASPAARRLLDAAGGDGEAGEAAWADVLALLPPAVREAVAQSRADGSGEYEGWLLRRFAADAQAGGAGLLLLKAAAADTDAAGDESASFSFTVSHDLRAPIRVVEGFTRILKEDYGRQIDRVGNDHLDRVLAAAARMNHMIDALLTLAKLSQQPLARQPVNLSQLATYVADDLRRSAPDRVAEFEIDPTLHTNGDPTLLRLVLENLLGNAWKYTARCKKAKIVFGSTTHEGRRAYVVRDNGAGFDMRSAERLFGLFQRLHSANDFPGTGVGLASVKRIVRRHGGEVWADAEPGRGAAFHFTLRE